MINNYKEKQKSSMKKKKKKKKQRPSNGDEPAPTKGGGLAGLMQLHTHHVFDLGVALGVGGLPLV